MAVSAGAVIIATGVLSDRDASHSLVEITSSQTDGSVLLAKREIEEQLSLADDTVRNLEAKHNHLERYPIPSLACQFEF